MDFSVHLSSFADQNINSPTDQRMDFTFGGCSDFRTTTFPTVAFSLHQSVITPQSNVHHVIQHSRMSQDDVAYLESTRERQLTELTPMAPFVVVPQNDTSLTLASNPSIVKQPSDKRIDVSPELIHKFDKFIIDPITKPQTVLNCVVAIKSSPRPALIRLQPNTTNSLAHESFLNTQQQSVPSKQETPKSVKSFRFVGMSSLPPVDFKSKHSIQDHLYAKVSYLKMFVCPVVGCEKSFKNRSDCTRHLRTHSDARPFLCTWPDCYYQGGKDRTTVLNHIRAVHFQMDVRTPGAKTVTNGVNPKAYLKVVKELL